MTERRRHYDVAVTSAGSATTKLGQEARAEWRLLPQDALVPTRHTHGIEQKPAPVTC